MICFLCSYTYIYMLSLFLFILVIIAIYLANGQFSLLCCHTKLKWWTFPFESLNSDCHKAPALIIISHLPSSCPLFSHTLQTANQERPQSSKAPNRNKSNMFFNQVKFTDDKMHGGFHDHITIGSPLLCKLLKFYL